MTSKFKGSRNDAIYLEGRKNKYGTEKGAGAEMSERRETQTLVTVKNRKRESAPQGFQKRKKKKEGEARKVSGRGKGVRGEKQRTTQ